MNLQMTLHRMYQTHWCCWLNIHNLRNFFPIQTKISYKGGERSKTITKYWKHSHTFTKTSRTYIMHQYMTCPKLNYGIILKKFTKVFSSLAPLFLDDILYTMHYLNRSLLTELHEGSCKTLFCKISNVNPCHWSSKGEID